MKRKEDMREHRGLSLFNIRLGLSNIHTEDEFADCAAAQSEVRPDYFRWFCGMHDLEETYICQVL